MSKHTLKASRLAASLSDSSPIFYLQVASLCLAGLIIYTVYKRLVTFVLNAFVAHRIGFPVVYAPPIDQNSYAWVILGPTTRLLLKRNLPTWLFNRFALTVYGVEFFQKDGPWKDYVEPQIRANPKLRGGGKSFVLVTGGRLEFWTYDIEFAKEMTARPNDFPQMDAASVVMNVFGSNVLTTDGGEWARHRRIVAGAVTERVSPIVWSESVKLTRALLESVAANDETDATPGSGTTNAMFDLVKTVTISVLYAAGMGNPQELESAGKQDELPPGTKVSYMDAVKIVNENAAGLTIIPTPILRNWPSWLPGAAYLHELAQAKLDFPIHTQLALKEEKERAAESGVTRNNVLSALVAASERNEGDVEKTTTRKKGPALSESELVGNLYIFTAAGFDTTANSIAYALVLLARYPKWQDWLIEELDQLLPEGPTADFDYTSIFPKAHRALAVLLETDRLFPPVIHITKMIREPQTVSISSCGTFTLPGMSNVYVNSIMLHKVPEIWRNLNMTKAELAGARDDEDGIRGDEHEYRPSRWINPPGSASSIFQPPKGGYMTWSAGPRVCPGMKMAHVEFVGILVTLFSRHKLEPVRKMVPVKGAKDVLLPESDDALGKRLEALIETSTPKLTLEMDVYNMKPGEDRGLGMRWVKRR